MMARLRDFVITEQDWIFAVVAYDLGGKGLECFLRYVPDAHGDRISARGRYRKVGFEEAYEFLRARRPEYLDTVHTVPKGAVKELLRPNAQLPRIAARNEKVRAVYEFLSRHIQQDRIGITGSYLCGLNAPDSDLDFVIYGRKHFDAARAAVAGARNAAVTGELPEVLWQRLYQKRNPELSYAAFIAHEKRKGHRGAISGTYFDLLYVRDDAELQLLDHRNYEKGERVGYRTITAEVIDASFAFDSPAIYELDHPEITKVLSFTHTYAGQAVVGETIEARGMVERTSHETRLVVGTTREARGEWIRSRSLGPFG
jgi:predicted nucleotidyltransferase